MNTKLKFDPVDPDKQLADILAFTKAWHQAQLRTPFDDLRDRIASARAAYIRKHNHMPTHVFLGQREYEALRMKPPYMQAVKTTSYQPETFFELEVVQVIKEEFLKVS